MKFDILTLFPEMFAPLEQSIIGRAVENNRIEINLTNIRDFSKDKHKKVDDTPYGGGKGMVIRPDVVYDAYESVKGENAKVAVRNIRRDAMDALKKKGKEDGISEDEIKGYEDDVQKSTDTYVKKVDEAVEAKSQEIMTV